jgi:hypothetical protein
LKKASIFWVITFPVTSHGGDNHRAETRFALPPALYPKRGAGPEQLRIKKATSEEMAYSLDRYVKRWQRWCTAGLDGFGLKDFTPGGET